MVTFVDVTIPEVGFKSSRVPGAPACRRFQGMREGGSLNRG